MIGVLGDITFETSDELVRTWQGMRRTGAARWTETEVYKGKPKREFQGPGLDTITFSVRLDINKGVIPRDELRKMRAHRDTGAVLPFTIGGSSVGDYTIDSLDEDLRHTDRNGVLVLANVSLQLKEYA